MDNNVIFKNGNGYIENPKCFSLSNTFDCGQCFRWNRTENGYEGIAFGKYLRIEENENKITFFRTDEKDFCDIWNKYFDFDTSYADIQNRLVSDEILKRAISFGGGIRILKQEPFEALISFIISQNNNIPRIKLIIERLSEKFGEKILVQGKTFYAFPKAGALYGIETGDLSELRVGFRDKYIVDAVEKINSGKLDLEEISHLSYDDALSKLKEIKGVGDKVANCVLLFGMGKTEAFPIDVWIKRTVEKLYFGGNAAEDIAQFAKERFSDLGGYAQQYLFYYARENKLA